MIFDGINETFTGRDLVYKYVIDPIVKSVVSDSLHYLNDSPKGTPTGGTNINVYGSNFHYVQNPQMYVLYNGKRYISSCVVKSSTHMKFKAPAINVTKEYLENLTVKYPEKLEYGFEFDQFSGFQNLSKKFNNFFMLFPDPVYKPFNETILKSDNLTIYGENLDLGYDESDVKVKIGIGDCIVTSISSTQLSCKPPENRPPSTGNNNQTRTTELPNVTVIVANTLIFNIGKLNYSQTQPQPETFVDSSLVTALYLSIVVIIVLSLISIAIFFICRYKATKIVRNLLKQMEILEGRVAAECKDAFTELQTEMTDLTKELTTDGIPFRDYRNYVMNVLFPNSEHQGVLHFKCPEVKHKETELNKFGDLILNKTFLLIFIQTLESNHNFAMSDRVKVASLITLTLQSNMQYCTDILQTLLAELIEKCMQRKLNPKLLLRQTECVAEKILSNWFSFLLYKLLHESVGEPLYMLFRAINQQVQKGPVDAIRGQARYSLSEDKLICNVIDFKPMTVYVSIDRYVNIPVHVQDCDTISQVKEKSLDTIYRTTSYSKRPAKKDDLVVEWIAGNSRKVLGDFDETNKKEGDMKQLNTLNHYNVQDGAHLTLKECKPYNINGKTANISVMKGKSHSNTLDRVLFTHNWHLVKQHDKSNEKKADRSNKMMSEVYLTRLLTTKGALEKFVDDLFKAIFNPSDWGFAGPIKNMFDFFDNQAIKHNITDPEVVHTWKSNALPLRFWVNLIKNPDFLFDIHKSHAVDSCLSVVAQVFMDSCGTSEHRLSTTSPSSKLLYAKNIPVYKEMVAQYYSGIKSMAITKEQLNAMYEEESERHNSDLNRNWVLYELYNNYAIKYKEQLRVALDEDQVSKKQELAVKLEQVHIMMSNNT
ncbi:hypothetical protein WDU94_002341 [Cyamophila willieti]